MSPDAYLEMARTQESHWWFAARRQILRAQLRLLPMPTNAQILEVGSGTGANVPLLAEFGRVVGLEMSGPAIALAKDACPKARERVQFLHGRCPEDLPRVAGGFDLVCLFDVLEHMEDDHQALAALHPLLRRDGRLLMTVPAYQWMWSPHDEHLHHHRRYVRASLLEACQRAGLEVERISYFNTFLFPLACATRAWEVARGRMSGATRTPHPLLNALLRRVFAFERYLLDAVSLPFGLSLLVVARPAAPRGTPC
jgi:SAM-dependent methyltransferase